MVVKCVEEKHSGSEQLRQESTVLNPVIREASLRRYQRADTWEDKRTIKKHCVTDKNTTITFALRSTGW